MIYSIEFTESAINDLRNISLYIYEYSKSIATATHFIKKIKEACLILEKFPEAGSIPRDKVLRSMNYRFISYDNYVIFYYFDEEKSISFILSFFNSKQDYINIIK